MIIIPPNTMGGLSGSTLRAVYIVSNAMFLTSLVVYFFIFLNDIYGGNFWQWSFDRDHQRETDTLGSMFFLAYTWIALFLINGLAAFMYLVDVIEKRLNKEK
jgi:hypothetical protein